MQQKNKNVTLLSFQTTEKNKFRALNDTQN